MMRLARQPLSRRRSFKLTRAKSRRWRPFSARLANTDIRSPVNGVIVQRSVELGQTVAASLQSPTIFTIADDLSRMEIAVSIDETDVGRVKPRQRVTFTVSPYPRREFEATVNHVI